MFNCGVAWRVRFPLFSPNLAFLSIVSPWELQPFWSMMADSCYPKILRYNFSIYSIVPPFTWNQSSRRVKILLILKILRVYQHDTIVDRKILKVGSGNYPFPGLELFYLFGGDYICIYIYHMYMYNNDNDIIRRYDPCLNVTTSTYTNRSLTPLN